MLSTSWPDSTRTMTATKIKQWRTAFDGLDKLWQTTAEMPQPSEGEVLVKILTVSLNYRDTEGARATPAPRRK